jgi:hypothetical protein
MRCNCTRAATVGKINKTKETKTARQEMDSKSISIGLLKLMSLQIHLGPRQLLVP